MSSLILYQGKSLFSHLVPVLLGLGLVTRPPRISLTIFLHENEALSFEVGVRVRVC